MSSGLMERFFEAFRTKCKICCRLLKAKFAAADMAAKYCFDLPDSLIGAATELLIGQSLRIAHA